jgi:hypothetical protein
MAKRSGTRDSYTAHGKRMLKAIKALKKRPYVKAGFPGAAGAKVHEEKETVGSLGLQVEPKAPSEPITLAELATVHEFASDNGHIPERGPIRATHAKRQGHWGDTVAKLKLKVISGEMSVRQALGLLGEVMISDIKAAYRRGGDPYVPNAPSTIAAKGSSTPLIDTAQLANGVAYERVNAD